MYWSIKYNCIAHYETLYKNRNEIRVHTVIKIFRYSIALWYLITELW